MARVINSIYSVMDIRPPWPPVDRVIVDTDLGDLTILLGPNASGKTMILEAIGYSLPLLLQPGEAALGLRLAETLRPWPLEAPPAIASILGLARGDAITVSIYPYIYIEPLSEKDVSRMLHGTMLEEIYHGKLAETIERDINTYLELIDKYGLAAKPVMRLGLSKSREFTKELIRQILGRDIYIGGVPVLGRENVLTEHVEEPESYKKLPALWSLRSIRFIYMLCYGKLSRGIVFRGRPSVLSVYDIIVVRKNGYDAAAASTLLVFHPGFVFRPGFFERLYRYYAKERGIPRRDEAIGILQKYIPWIEDFELFGRTLAVRTRDDRSVSVYSLSDGQRMAVLLGVLYAFSRGDAVYLIDTPEAFVHPDGLDTVARLIAGLVRSGAQVVVATQSLEFLRSLLEAAREEGVIGSTSVKRIRFGEKGIVSPMASWSGEAGRDIIDELGVDLRR